jgi:hypothetical protein
MWPLAKSEGHFRTLANDQHQDPTTLDETELCPDPKICAIVSSSWLKQTNAQGFGCERDPVERHDMWLETRSLASFGHGQQFH